MMRELYMIEFLIHIIYLPFQKEFGGEFMLKELKQTDIIVIVCKKAYEMIKLIGLGYFQNEMYLSQWINLYFQQSM